MNEWYTEHDFDPDGEIYRPYEEIPVGRAQDVESVGSHHGIKGREFNYEEWRESLPHRKARAKTRREYMREYMREYRLRKPRGD